MDVFCASAFLWCLVFHSSVNHNVFNWYISTSGHFGCFQLIFWKRDLRNMHITSTFVHLSNHLLQMQQQGQSACTFKVLLPIAKHALWKDLTCVLKVRFNVLIYWKTNWCQGWRQGEVCGPPSDSVFSEHCWVHMPNGGVRPCQGFVKSCREPGSLLMPGQIGHLPGSSPGWLTPDFGTLAFE